jgi:arylsulfatase A-like enzyme
MVGELVAELRTLGLDDTALVVVTADHGEALYEHGFISHNEQVFEESTHVPLVLRLPDAAGMRGLRVAELVDTTDIPATLADAAGVLARARGFRGRSLLPVMKGAPGRSAVVSRSAGEESRYAVRMPRYKCVVDTRSGAEELFDLEADPGERADRGTLEPGRLLHCRQALHRLLLDQRRERASLARPPELTPQQLENLRALGYVE